MSTRAEISVKMLSLHARIDNQQTTVMYTPRKQACMGLKGGSIIKTTNYYFSFSMADNSSNGGEKEEERKRKKSGDGVEDILLNKYVTCYNKICYLL